MRSQVALLACAAWLAASGGGSPAHAQSATGQQPVFRAQADAVVVAVAVRTKNRPVGGLRADDFQLLDNGVPQLITSTTAEAVPVDVTLVLDTSGSISGTAFQRLKADIRRMAALLKPDDRVRLLSFSFRVTDATALQPGTSDLPLEGLATGGTTSFYNALGAALALSPGADRPQLVFGVSDGFDNASFLVPREIADMAGSSSAALYIALLPSRVFTTFPGASGSNMGALQGDRFGAVLAGSGPTRVPVDAPYQRAMRDAVAATGGAFYTATSDDTLPGLFRRVLDDFRTNYVLRYSPTGVEPGGWHELTIEVPSQPDATIRSRRGYQG
jgi:VWFA-related protein